MWCVCVWGAANEPPTERMIVTVYLMNMNLRSLRSIRLGGLQITPPRLTVKTAHKRSKPALGKTVCVIGLFLNLLYVLVRYRYNAFGPDNSIPCCVKYLLCRGYSHAWRYSSSLLE